MAEVVPPSYLQNGAHSALSDRLTVSGLMQPGGTGLTPRGGVKASSDGNGMAVVAAATANNTVVVRAGTCFVPAASGTGVYVCHNDADRVLTVPSASTTQSRRDIVVAQVRDSTLSGANDDWVLTIVQGTPSSGTPVAPAAPANSLLLGEYLVPAGSSTIVTNANITDRRSNVSALGGVTAVLSTALPVNPYRSMTVWCTDTEDMRVWNGSAWRVQSFFPIPDPAFASYAGTTTVTGTAATFLSLSPALTLNFTASRPLWALVTLNVWLSIDVTSVRAALYVTGATTGPGAGGILATSGNWGEIPASSTTGTIQCSVTQPVKFNTGTTTVEAKGWRGSTAGTPNVDYPAIRIIPMRYA